MSLPPPPRLDDKPNGGLSAIRAKGNGTAPLSSDTSLHRDGMLPRGKTARELTIGRKLRDLREQQHLTQQEMAGRAGVPRTYISRIENARLLPGPTMLQRIAGALGVSILALLPGNGNGNGSSDASGDPFWKTLAGYFRQLQPEQMAVVLSHVREAVSENSENREYHFGTQMFESKSRV